MANLGKAFGAGLSELGVGTIARGEAKGNMMYLIAASDKEHARKAGLATAKAQQEGLGEVYKQTVGSHKELIKIWGANLAAGTASPELTLKIFESNQNVLKAQNDLLRNSGLKPLESKEMDWKPLSIDFQNSHIKGQEHLADIKKQLKKNNRSELDHLLKNDKFYNSLSSTHKKNFVDQVVIDINKLSIEEFKPETKKVDPKDLPVSQRGFLDSTGKEQARRVTSEVVGALSDWGSIIANVPPNVAEVLQEWWTGEEQDPIYQFSAGRPTAEDTIRTGAGREDIYRWLGGEEGYYGAPAGGQAGGMASPTGATGPSGGPGGVRGGGSMNPQAMATQAAGASMAAQAQSAASWSPFSSAYASQPGGDPSVPFESDPAAAAEARILAGQQAQAQGGGQQPSPQEATQQTLTEAPPDDVAAIKRFMQQLLQLIEQMGQAEAIQAMAKQFRGLSSSQKQILLADKQYGAAFKQLVR